MRPSLASLVLLLAGCVEPPADPPTPPPEPAAEAPSPSVAGPSEDPPATQPGRMSVIDLSTCFELQQGGQVLLIDVRPGFVRAFGSIPGSISWPEKSFESGLAENEPRIRAAASAGRAVVLYCTDASCPDSHKVATRLAARGHDVAILEGGFADWKEAGLPVE